MPEVKLYSYSGARTVRKMVVHCAAVALAGAAIATLILIAGGDADFHPAYLLVPIISALIVGALDRSNHREGP